VEVNLHQVWPASSNVAGRVQPEGCSDVGNSRQGFDSARCGSALSWVYDHDPARDQQEFVPDWPDAQLHGEVGGFLYRTRNHLNERTPNATPSANAKAWRVVGVFFVYLIIFIDFVDVSYLHKMATSGKI